MLFVYFVVCCVVVMEFMDVLIVVCVCVLLNDVDVSMSEVDY